MDVKVEFWNAMEFEGHKMKEFDCDWGCALAFLLCIMCTTPCGAGFLWKKGMVWMVRIYMRFGLNSSCAFSQWTAEWPAPHGAVYSRNSSSAPLWIELGYHHGRKRRERRTNWGHFCNSNTWCNGIIRHQLMRGLTVISEIKGGGSTIWIESRGCQWDHWGGIFLLFFLSDQNFLQIRNWGCPVQIAALGSQTQLLLFSGQRFLSDPSQVRQPYFSLSLSIHTCIYVYMFAYISRIKICIDALICFLCFNSRTN